MNDKQKENGNEYTRSLKSTDSITAEIIFPDRQSEVPLYEDLPPLDFGTLPKYHGFNIARFITYFKPKESTTFPNCKLKIYYSKTAWNKAIANLQDQEADRPRVAYLSRIDKNNWAENWVEFTDISPEFYESDDLYASLTINIDGLPDPLIGGC